MGLYENSYTPGYIKLEHTATELTILFVWLTEALYKISCRKI